MIEDEFQPVRKIKIERDLVEFRFCRDDVLKVRGEVSGSRGHAVPFNLAKMFFDPLFKKKDGKYEVFPMVIGTSVVPVINRSFFLFGVRPLNYYSYQGKFCAFGGLLGRGNHPFENALKELGEELVLYDFKSRELLTFDFNKSLVNYQIGVLEKLGLEVKDVRFLDYMFLTSKDANKIKSVYDDGSKEDSIGYVRFDREPWRVSITYPLVVLEDIPLEDIVPVHYELGGEMVVFLHYKQIPLIRPSYFISGLYDVLLNIVKEVEFLKLL